MAGKHSCQWLSKLNRVVESKLDFTTPDIRSLLSKLRPSYGIRFSASALLLLLMSGASSSKVAAGLVIEVDKVNKQWKITGSLDVTGATENGTANYGSSTTYFGFDGSSQAAISYIRTGTLQKYKIVDMPDTNWTTGTTTSGYSQGLKGDVDTDNPSFRFSPNSGLYLPTGQTIFNWTEDLVSTPTLSAALLGVIPDGDFSSVYTVSGTNGTQTVTVKSLSSSVTPVPEPSSAIAIGLLGIVGFSGNRRRRRSSTV